MKLSIMKSGLGFLVLGFMVLVFGGWMLASFSPASVPAADDISVPAGFKATVFADKLGRARHLTVNTNGDVYVKLDKLKDGKGIMRLRDKNSDGVADDISGFGNFTGTGIVVRDGILYASSDDEVFRYKIGANGPVNGEEKERVVTGLVNKGQHSAKALTLDNAGNLYVVVGAPSNDCQEKDRTKGSPGMSPCPILENAGGIWQFKADGKDQSYGQGVRYATGLRNVVGMAWNNQANDLYAMQHGRDMLFQFYPEMYSQQDGALNPSEEFFRLKPGSDCGWPYCYYDMNKKAKLLNPEYGGDRNKAGDCGGKTQSIVQFPGHMGPNGLLFYTGDKFPAKYKNGAFIAFHGSWNRSPEPQEGYFVVFQPMKDGQPDGAWEVFADGFAGAKKDPGGAMYRPCGLAQGPDGSIYVSEDQKGRVWKITYGK